MERRLGSVCGELDQIDGVAKRDGEEMVGDLSAGVDDVSGG